MVEHEQTRPLAPSADRTASDDEEAAVPAKKASRFARFIKWFGIVMAILVVLAIVILILTFTVFRMKEPHIELNNVIITHMEMIDSTTLKPGSNISLIADVSVKNRNVLSFNYDGTTSFLYFQGEQIGEARGSPAYSKAHRTMRMNVTVNILADKIGNNLNLYGDGGLITVDSYTKLSGSAKFLFVTKHVTTKMTCGITANMMTKKIEKQKCNSRVDV